jgi:hypothetical protein
MKGDIVSEIRTPRDLFLHELGDILDALRALVDEALPQLIGEVGRGVRKRSVPSRRPDARPERREGVQPSGDPE